MSAVMEKKVFTMPKPDVGDVVLHRHLRGSSVAVAFVLEVFERTITCHVMAAHVYNLTPMAAVRHIEDPDVSPEHEGGFWEFRPKDEFNENLLGNNQRRLMALEEAVKELQKKS